MDTKQIQVMADHMNRLLRSSSPAPYRVKRRGLVADLGPVVAGQLADFRAPIGERRLLPTGDVFLHCCSRHKISPNVEIVLALC
jgi:hypothetical protein